MARVKSIMDGSMAATHVAHATNEVIAIYPITPSSAMGEIADEKTTRMEKNIWGSVPDVMMLQSEAGAVGTVHGALATGAMTTTFTASQGLLLMIPTMFKIAGELIPTVFHVSARAIASQGLSIFGDHSDVMSTRTTGWSFLCSNNPQEVMDFALISQAVTLRTRVPMMHFFDGFRTSHELNVVEELTFDDMRHMIDNDLVREHRERSLSPDHPSMRGTAQNPDVYFQGRETVNSFFDKIIPTLKAEFKKFEKLTGRHYDTMEYVGDKDAEQVIIILCSAGDISEETSIELNKTGYKTGVIKVRLFQPFDVETFAKILPKTVKGIAVLDRTKEPGAIGEPLYLTIRTAVGEIMCKKMVEFKNYPLIVGGRYGLGSKDYTPAMVKAVYDNLLSKDPKNSFSVGIIDDVTNLSLDVDKSWYISTPETFEAVFIGLGSDGTVGANKNTAKIINTEAGKEVQAYFVYDSKKAGSVTTSHLRFGDKAIKSSYLIEHADFLACHNFFFLERFDVIGPLNKGGSFLLNSPYSATEVWENLPSYIREQIVAREARFYVIDAIAIARELGLGSRYNVILQTAFFAISNIIPVDKVLEAIKKANKKSYGKYGDNVVTMNNNAAEYGATKFEEVMYPGRVDKASKEGHVPYIELDLINGCLDPSAPKFVQEVTAMLVADRGEEIKVSQMPVDGTWPIATTQYEKRNLAVEIPVWESDICIQCGLCAFHCPHSAIRVASYPKSELDKAPSTFQHVQAKGKGFEDYAFTVQVAPEDCVDCSVCVINCPAVSKTDPNLKAINMRPQMPIRDTEVENYKFFLDLPELSPDQYNKATIKGLQFAPYGFEYSGACAGCGETPYIKVLTQLFGDRLYLANATGCSSIYGGNLPTTPYCDRSDGLGPAWGNSLFENNAEYGYGMKMTVNYFTAKANKYLEDLKGDIGDLYGKISEAPAKTQSEIELKRVLVKELKTKLAGIKTEEAKDFLSMADFLLPKSTWMMGGDGWAYDIGYGGLDHVLASGENLNILVLDTEVYSNTGGQASKSTPLGATAKFATSGKMQEKKDLAMIAMTYGSIYVARVSLANPAQCLKAFIEAEAYNGPSLIIAYSHCIAQGLDMTYGVDHQKKAIEAGYWQLIRYNPDLIDQGKNPLIIDSKDATIELADFMAIENRFKITKKADPAKYNEIVEEASLKQKRRNSYTKQLVEKMDFIVE